eukprot:scaffold17305_cov172-Amphora_coffeaeformis.AAC.5
MRSSASDVNDAKKQNITYNTQHATRSLKRGTTELPLVVLKLTTLLYPFTLFTSCWSEVLFVHGKMTMKGSLKARRFVSVCLLLLSLSRSARSVSFLQGKSTCTRRAAHSSSSPSATRTTSTTKNTLTTSASSHSSSNGQGSHRRSGGGGTLWRVFSHRTTNSASSWWPLAARKTNATATATAEPTGMFPSLASLATLTNHVVLRRDDHASSTVTSAGSSNTATTERPSSPSSPSSSVHLRLRTDDGTTTVECQPNGGENNNKNANKPPSKSSSKYNLKIHSFTDARGKVYKAVNTPREKFEAFLDYHKVVRRYGKITTQETTTQVDAATAAARRQEWRELWKQGQLLTERTEYLAVYPSDQEQGDGKNNKSKARVNGSKRGGFSDLLHLYAQRLLSFLRDEQQDKKSILRWLQKEYGRTATARLSAEELSQYPPSEQLSYLKEFLEWFRSQFPYYYDRCGNCGASIREDLANNMISDSTDSGKGGHKTFLGYVYPLKPELKGKASRTELYQCHKCHSYTRFPRYNSAWHVMEHKRGRCGEYSMLLFRMMRALGHETRWVVDWADHVWVELFCARSGEWIHLDPCEAAVRENLLYQGWGKKQTYVLGFYAPLATTNGSVEASTLTRKTPLIEDITSAYTSDTRQEIQTRRDESERQVQAALEKATEYLRGRLTAGVYDDE